METEKKAEAEKELNEKKVSDTTTKSKSTDTDTDNDMPEPDIKDYDAAAQGRPSNAGQIGHGSNPTPSSKPKVTLKLNAQFKDTLEKTIGSLGYNRELGIPERHIQVFQIFDIIKNIEGKYISDTQLNELLNIIALAPYNVIAGFMEKVRTAKGQAEFWTLKKN